MGDTEVQQPKKRFADECIEVSCLYIAVITLTAD